MTEQWRDDPATEKQKAKLHFFGCTWDEGITKGQAHDALGECTRLYPEKDAEWYNRPASEEELAKLRQLLEPDGETPEDYADEGKPLTHGQAKELLEDIELQRIEKENAAEEAYERSDEAVIDELGCLPWMDDFPGVTRDQVGKALTLAKSRSAGTSERPADEEIQDTLEELYPQFRPTAITPPRYQCRECGAIYKARFPAIRTIKPDTLNSFTKEDIILSTVKCPSCGRQNQVLNVRTRACTCPHCSEECLVAASQAGHTVRHLNGRCTKEFTAIPTQPSTAEPRIRLMHYAEQS